MSGRRTGFAGVIAAMACYLALFAPAALAAPANDDFGNAQALTPGTGITVTASNLGATKETGESLGTFAAGHSVWFEWEATSTGFVTIGSCDADFSDLVGIFEGTALTSLTPVVSRADEGPDCPFRPNDFGQNEFTFKATSGTTYIIAVDGQVVPVPEGPLPPTEGEFTLRIEATPLPPNDDFENAEPIVGEIFEEPGGDRFYFANVHGYNWQATKQSEEPDHEGDPGGASVWYTWTAPESGQARFSVCCSKFTLGIYSGNSLGSLTALENQFLAGAPVTGGTTYRIAVDGKTTGGSPWMGSFELSVGMTLAPNRSQGESTLLAPASPTPTAPPQTTILRRSIRASKRKATFAFASSANGSSFRCKLDGKRFSACTSPKTFKHLKAGAHTFSVIAVDAAGAADPTPAVAHFTIAARSTARSG